MITHSDRGDKSIPHRDNIVSIHKNLSYLHSLTECNPLFAGGYPTALLLAPRAKGNSIELRPGYYNDYDVYFETSENLDRARAHLLANSATALIETNNAATYGIAMPNGFVQQIQLIKLIIDTPENILSSFDFVNSAVGYQPLTDKIYFHTQVFDCHIERKLEILNPWMLASLDTIQEENIIIQLLRFKKYCLRWEYNLSDKAFNLLLDIYNRFPKCKVTRNQHYRAASQGAYAQTYYIALRNENIWNCLASIIKRHPNWDNSLDKHGVLVDATGDSDPVVCPLPVNNTIDEVEDLPF
jgi:hypothetical protein